MQHINELITQLAEAMAAVILHPDCPPTLHDEILNFSCEMEVHGNNSEKLAASLRGPVTVALLSLVEEEGGGDEPILIDPHTPPSEGDSVATEIKIEPFTGQSHLGLVSTPEVWDLREEAA